MSKFIIVGTMASAFLWAGVSHAQMPFARARELARETVDKMTLEEKIQQLHGVRDGDNYRVVPGIPRLAIPAFQITNGPAGVGPGRRGRQPRATALPAPIALAASWSPSLARQYGQLAGQETRVLGSMLLEGPDINIARVPQSGRTFEGFGEDPWLTSRIGVAEIEGVQSSGVMANVKHYVANNQETNRMTVNELIDQRTLREIYMPGFRAAVQEAHVDSVMCAYPRINGTFNCENASLLQVLKHEWGLQGFVVSDFEAVHSTVPSILAGLDLEMPTGEYFSDALKAAILSGKVPISRIDDALIRRYTQMIELGMFSRKKSTQQQDISIPSFEHGAISRRIAEQSTVLLKNERNILPLDEKHIRTLALIGPAAMEAQTGGGGSSYVNPLYTIRPRDGIYSHVSRLRVVDGSNIAEAVAAAKWAQVAIVMIGDHESEGEDHAITLPDVQNQLVAAVAAANPNTVVVLKTGSAVLMPWLNSVPAVLEAWYPGEEDGNAVANVLFGDAEPGGRLPLSFPATEHDTLAEYPRQYPGQNDTVIYNEGLKVGYRWYQSHAIEPLFPFGFGLSYTRFAYSSFSAVQTGTKQNPQVALSYVVRNIGSRAGSDVPQVYVTFPPIPEGDEPPMQLKAFEKITLAPGQSMQVHVVLKKDAFSYWSPSSGQWTVPPGKFAISLARSSNTVELKQEVMFR